MSNSHFKDRRRLSVRAPDPATEIFVVDSKFRRIASALGELSINVSPGIYKVRFRSGNKQRDQLVEVSSEEPEIFIEGDPLNFNSAAPIENTRTSREYHLIPAVELSRQVHLQRGRGSQLFVFARDTKPDGNEQPWTGVSIHSLNGEKIAELSAGDCDDQRRFGALNIELDPGTYRLRVETGSVGTYEMFLVTAPGWQTQVFLMVSDFNLEKKSIRRAVLKTASVLMAYIGAGFNPGSGHIRLAELARQGLSTGRNVASNVHLRRMLQEKFEDPMLGIYGAHLLARSYRPRHSLINIVVGNLQNMLGPHPDVQALALRSGNKKSKRALELSFPAPPMLQSSWDLIVRRSLGRVATVPPGSQAERLADNLLPSTPWLLHRVPEDRVLKASTMPFAHAKNMLESLVKLGAKDEGHAILESVRRETGNYSPLELNIINQTLGAGMRGAEMLGGRTEEIVERGIDVSQILRGLDAPSSTISRSMASLSVKLDLHEFG